MKKYHSHSELEKQHKILSLRLKLLYAWIALRSLRYYHLGDIIIYKNEKWVITNGVTYHKWNLSKLNSNERVEYVDEKEFKAEKSFRNLKNRFFHTYYWKKNYWFDIELRNLISKEERCGKYLEKHCLNDTVEIIEEDKKIEKLKGEDKGLYIDYSKANIVDKINEIIDEINKLKEDK